MLNFILFGNAIFTHNFFIFPFTDGANLTFVVVLVELVEKDAAVVVAAVLINLLLLLLLFLLLFLSSFTRVEIL